MATVGDRRPEVSQNLSDVRFPGRGPRAVSLDTQYKKDVLWMGLGSASLPLKAQYLQNVALRLPGTKPHLKGSTPSEPLQLALQQKLQQFVVASAKISNASEAP